ncbi:hypothetical protein NE237_014153 [Protea cynaroides]|uniref:Disease resistance R13L4/SHOC-2-like LRR domain-containing protein n=1 Tax=Protea cynaroides TaxID=273540 RepID=A0A9Q0GNN3_9MAGN|nr:hypothetical protein NE237_014153 [Protea cynaroides]
METSHEAKLIKLIVEDVWSVLRKSPLIAHDNLVECDFHVENMMKLLKIESDDGGIVGTERVKGLCIERITGSNREELKSRGFSQMKDINLLNLDYAKVSGKFKHSFSELRWLSWKGFCNTEFTLTKSRELTVLVLSHGYITENWQGWRSIKEAKNLKFLDLSYSAELSETPNFSANLQLEVLHLEGCKNLATIDASICELSSLKTLDIRFTKISQFPEKLSRLVALTELLIDRTEIRRLPNSIGKLKNLKTLSAQYCKIQKGGIDVIGGLRSLKHLNLNGNQFPSLPKEVSDLGLLQTLSLMSCDKLQSLPPLLSKLTNLKALHIIFCKNLVELPNTMNCLTGLKSLDLQGCDALKYISSLPSSLKSLEIACKNVITISAFWDMRNLETLSLHDCPSLEKIQKLEGLDSLWLFKISKCPSLKELESLQGLKKLKHLEFNDIGLKKIDGIEELHSLEKLRLSSIPLQKSFNLSNLEKEMRTKPKVSLCSENHQICKVGGGDNTFPGYGNRLRLTTCGYKVEICGDHFSRKC